MLDLFSRRLLACPISEHHPDAELCMDAIKIAVAVRGGREQIQGVIFHSDRGSTSQATSRTGANRKSASGSRWAESYFSTRTRGRVPAAVRDQGRGPHRRARLVPRVVNTRRRHSSAALLPPAEFEKITAAQPAAA